MSLVEFFADHTYRTMLVGTMTIGVVAGALGSFAYVRKQSLMSDVVSHAALPGAMLAFLIASMVPGLDARSMAALMCGAIATGTLAVLVAQRITASSKISIDTAMAISLTLFFATGMLLMRVITSGPFPNKGGIHDYLFGNASVMTRADIAWAAGVGAIALALMLIFFKEFTVRSFDPDFASALGLPSRRIDTIMFATIAVATVIGVKAVGLVLMVAFIITPPAAARQWTQTMPTMVALSAAIGALGSAIGSYVAVAVGKVPTGPLIVVSLFAIFLISLLASPRRSMISAMLTRARVRRDLRLHQDGAGEDS